LVCCINSPDGLHHYYACNASASWKAVADANYDKRVNACAGAGHANTNIHSQRHTVTATADTNRNTRLHPAYGNSHASANVDGQPHALTIGTSTNQNSDAHAACGNTSSYINPSANHRKRKPDDAGALPLCSYWYGST
jgi:hypothetical protein